MCTASRAFSAVIVVFNVLGVLFSLIITALGGIILWGGSLISQILAPFSSQIKNAMPEFNIDFNSLIGDITKYLSNVGIVLFIVGLLLLAVCVLGCVGATRSHRIILIIYALLVAVIFIGLMIMLIATMYHMFLNVIDSSVTDIIGHKFNENTKTNGQTMLVTLMQFELQCCGVANGNDYSSASVWNRTYAKTLSSGAKILTTLKYPVSCCVSKNFAIVDYNCTTFANSVNSNYLLGCGDALKKKVTAFSTIISLIPGIPMGITALLLTMTILLIKVLERKNKVGDESTNINRFK